MGSPDVLGETMRLDGELYTIVGVAHPKLEFASFRTAQVITPMILNRSEPNPAIRYLSGFSELSFQEQCQYHFNVGLLPYYLRADDHFTMSIPIEHH